MISEFLASNPGPYRDGDGDTSDWIEVHNTGTEAVDLGGWELVDSSNIWPIPALTLGSNERRIIFASSKDRRDPAAELHTNFKLTAGGEDLLLRDDSGTTVSAYQPYPMQSSGVSYGVASTGEVGPLLSPTPGAPNAPLAASAATPVAAVGRSVQTASFIETLTTATPGAVIRYTLDGSDPTVQSPIATDGRLSIDPSGQALTRLRARAFAADLGPSTVLQVTYVNPTQAAQDIDGGSAVAESIEALPIVLLGTATGSEPKRPGSLTESTPYEQGNVEYIDGDDGFAADVGTTLFGNFSAFYPNWSKLSYRVKFDGEWGQDLEYPVFADRGNEFFTPPTRFDKLEFRGFSNDGMAVSTTGTYMSNEFLRTLLHDLGSPSTHFRYVNLFMNGEYRGVYSMRERVGDAWLASNYGGDEDDYEWVTRTNSFEVKNGTGAIDGAVRRSTWVQARDMVNADAFINAAMTLSWYASYLSTENEWHLVSPVDPDHPHGMVPIPNDVDGMLGHRYHRGRSETYANRITAWRSHDEFKNILWDRAARAFCGDGEMTTDRLRARVEKLAGELRPAMRGEMAALANLGFTGRTASAWESNVTTAANRVASVSAVRDAWQAAGWFNGCNQAPTLTGPAQTLSITGTYGALAFDASDDGGSVTFAGHDLPPGLAMNPSTGVVSGTPTTPGEYRVAVDAVDSADRFGRLWVDWTVLAADPASTDDPPVVLNEYNAVSSTNGWNGTNSTSPAGFDPATNGGDWLELLVRHDHLDLRGYTLELLDRDDRFARLERREVFEFSDADVLADLRSGTLITIAESIPEDRSYRPASGDWHINANSSTALAGGLITAASRSNFGTNADSLHVILRNPSGQIVAPVLGETDTWAALGDDVDQSSIQQLCSTRPAANLHDVKVSSTRSTFGEANDCGATQGGGQVQPLHELRPVLADVDCDGRRSVADAHALAQHRSGARPAGVCDPDRPSQISRSAADLNGDGELTSEDIDLLLACLVDLPSC